MVKCPDCKSENIKEIYADEQNTEHWYHEYCEFECLECGCQFSERTTTIMSIHKHGKEEVEEDGNV